MKIYDIDKAFCEEVIITTKEKRGNGRNEVMRVITEVYDKQGNKIAEHDPHNDLKKFDVIDLLHFADWTAKCLGHNITSTERDIRRFFDETRYIHFDK
jgi:hypothetical protein